MTQHESKILELASRSLGVDPSSKTLRRLIDGGLISFKACERLAYKSYVDRLIAKGIARSVAMEMAATEFSCSYEKIRRFIYLKPIKDVLKNLN